MSDKIFIIKVYGFIRKNYIEVFKIFANKKVRRSRNEMIGLLIMEKYIFNAIKGGNFLITILFLP